MSTDEKDKTYMYNVLVKPIPFLSGYHEITILGFTFIFYLDLGSKCASL